MCNRRISGFTLIEMVMAIVIIGVGLAGVLMALSTTVRSSADPMIRKQMLAIGEGMMEEVLLKPYAAGTGVISGCDRSLADDIFDYGAYADQPICDIDGTAVAGLGGYSVTVALTADTLAGGVPAQRVTVTVKYGTSETLDLVSWRTDYAS